MLRYFIRFSILMLVVHPVLFTFRPAAAQANRPDLIWMRGGTRGIPQALAYSADGKLLASGDNSGNVKVWRMADKMLLRTFRHNGEALSVAFSPGGKFVASVGAGENAVRVRRFDDGTVYKTLSGPFAKVLSVAISPDSQILAAGCDGGHIALWRWLDGTAIEPLSALSGDVSYVTFSPNSQYLVGGSDGTYELTIRLWRMTDRHYIAELAALRAKAVAFSPDSQTLVTNFGLWNASDGSRIRSFSVGGASAAFSPDGQTAAFAGYSGGRGYVSFVRASDGAFIRQEDLGHYEPYALAASPNSPELALGNVNVDRREQGDLLFWDWSTAKFSYEIGVSFSQAQVTFSSDGQTLAAANPYYGFGLFRASDGTPLTNWGAGGGPVYGMTTIPNSDLFVTSGNGTFVRRFTDGSLVRRLTDRSYSRIAVSPDGETLAGGDWASSNVDLWRISDGTLLNSFSSFYPGIRHLAFSPDGRWFAVIPFLRGDRFSLYDTFTWERRELVPPSRERPLSLSFSPDSQTLATGDNNGNIDLWNVVAGSPRTAFVASTSGVYALAFAPNGFTLASLDNQRLRIWNAEDGTPLASYNQETEPIDSGDRILQYSPDGKMITYGRLDGTICTVLNPYRSAIFPPKGGNTGNVTFKIVTPSTFPVPEGATVILRDSNHPDISVNATNLNNNDHVLTGTFALNGAPLGVRDVVIAKPDGETLSYSQGFTVEAGVVPQISSEILGQTRLRLGARQSFTLMLRNQGNVDAMPYDVRIQLPRRAEWWLSDEFHPHAVDYSEENFSLSIPVPLIPAGGVKTIPITVRVPFRADYVGQHLHFWAWANPDPQAQVVIFGGPDESLLIRAENASHDVVSYFGRKDTRGLAITLTHILIQSADGHHTTVLLDTQGRPVQVQGEDGTKITIEWISATRIRATAIAADGTVLGSVEIDIENQGGTEGRGGIRIQGLSACISPREACQLLGGLICTAVRTPGLMPLVCVGLAAVTGNPIVFRICTAGALGLQILCQPGGGFPSILGRICDNFSNGDYCFEMLAAIDPNELIGPGGFEVARWLSDQQPLTYITYFENIPQTGGASAQAVEVIDYLDPLTLDLTTVSLGAIRFGDKVVEPTPEVNPPVGLRQFYYEVPLPEQNLTVRITASLDMLTGELLWRYVACDAEGNCPPLDPFLGFLPPNQNPPEGEGSVTVSVMPKTGLITGTVVQTRAVITFDPHFGLPSIAPNPWFNTIDSDKPVSRVSSLPARINSATIPVQWTMNDVGSGVQGVTIYVSEDGGPYTSWLTNTTERRATFLGESGHSYAFKARATDNVGNLEDEHATPDAVTHVKATIPLSGKVRLEECVHPAQTLTLEFRPLDGSGNFTQTVTLASDGTFRVKEIPVKRYQLAIKGSKWLQKVVPIDLRGKEGRTPLPKEGVLLLAGDANNNNVVETDDLAALIQAFDASPTSDNWNGGVADFNCDEFVSLDDLALLVRNFNRQGEP